MFCLGLRVIALLLSGEPDRQRIPEVKHTQAVLKQKMKDKRMMHDYMVACAFRSLMHARMLRTDRLGGTRLAPHLPSSS